MSGYPVIIVGGSLAGLAAAIRLAQHGVSPLVIEKSRFPRPKLCGEFLGPDSYAALETLGVFEEVNARAWGPIDSAEFYMTDGACLTVPMRWLNREKPYGLGISRMDLDWLLLQKARTLGISVLEETRILPNIQRQQQDFILSTGNGEEYCTPCLIDASGRHGGLFSEDAPAPQPRVQNQVGISLHVKTESPADKTLRMFFFPGGYGGIQPLSESELNVCMLVDKSLGSTIKAPYPEFIQQTIGQNVHALQQLENTTALTEFLTTANLNMSIPQQARLIQIGDARLTIDPITGSGMAIALETGILAADIIAKAGQDYGADCRKYNHEYRRRFGTRLALLQRFRPLLFSPQAQRQFLPLLRPALPLLAKAFR